MATNGGEQGIKSTNPAMDFDMDAPIQPGLELAQFAVGCFWGVELAFPRLEGVVKTGSQASHVHNQNYKLVCTGSANHTKVVRVHFDPNIFPYIELLSLLWTRHNPTTFNCQNENLTLWEATSTYVEMSPFMSAN